MPKAFRGRIAMFEYQTPATLNQAAPVQNTWYTILDTTGYVRVYVWGVNVEDVNEDLEVRATIDGETMTGSITATHSTDYFVGLGVDAVARVDNLRMATLANAGHIYSSFILEGHSIKLEVRKTSANGAGNLTACVAYGIMTDIP